MFVEPLADQLRAITAAFESEFRNGAAADMKALFNAPLLLDDDFFCEFCCALRVMGFVLR
ncbi:MAG: hypothetical protein P4L40_12760 [Terracidiphilus sp.]|nr:hypothetical protein [Terracidiphilus sp.]